MAKETDINIQKENYDMIFRILLDEKLWLRNEITTLYAIRKKILIHFKKPIDPYTLERWMKIILDIQSRQKLNGEIVLLADGTKLFVKKKLPEDPLEQRR